MAITINALSSPQLDLPKSVSVALDTTVTGSSYLWELLDRPENSTASLSSSFVQNPTITPDVAGTYTLKLTVDANSPVYGGFGVALSRSNLRVPASGEDDPAEGGVLEAPRGWAAPLNRLLRYMDKFTNKGSLDTCRNNSGLVLNKGDAVYISGRVVWDTGLPEAIDVPDISKASAAAISTLGAVGIVLENVDGTTSVANGELCRVLFFGILPNVNTTGTSVNDPVYVQDTAGTWGFSAGSNEFAFGRVVEVGASGAIMVYPASGRISGSPVDGTGATNQVTYWADVDTVTGDPAQTYDPATAVQSITKDGAGLEVGYSASNSSSSANSAAAYKLIADVGASEVITYSSGTVATVFGESLGDATGFLTDGVAAPSKMLIGTQTAIPMHFGTGGSKALTVDVNQDVQMVGSALFGAGTQTTNGTIRYSGSDLEGRIGGSWVSLTQQSAIDGSGAANQITRWLDADTITGDAELVYGDTPGILALTKNQAGLTRFITTNTTDDTTSVAQHSVLSTTGATSLSMYAPTYLGSGISNTVFQNRGLVSSDSNSSGFMLGTFKRGGVEPTDGTTRGDGTVDVGIGPMSNDSGQGSSYFANLIASFWANYVGTTNNTCGLFIGEDSRNAPQTDRLQIHDPLSRAVHTRYTNATTGKTDNNGLRVGIDASENAVFHNYENTDMLWYSNNTQFMQWDESDTGLTVQRDQNAMTRINSFNFTSGTQASSAVWASGASAGCSIWYFSPGYVDSGPGLSTDVKQNKAYIYLSTSSAGGGFISPTSGISEATDGTTRGTGNFEVFIGKESDDSGQGAGYYASSVFYVWGSGGATTNNTMGVFIGEDARSGPKTDRLHIHDPLSRAVHTRYTNATTGKADNNGLRVGIDASENAEIHNYEATDIIWYTNNAEVMRWDHSASSLGIGISAPTEKVHVKGTTSSPTGFLIDNQEDTAADANNRAFVKVDGANTLGVMEAYSSKATGTKMGVNKANLTFIGSDTGQGSGNLAIGSAGNISTYFGANNGISFVIDVVQDITIYDTNDINFGTSVGSNVAGAASQKMAFWGATPIVQPSLVASLTDSSGGTANDTVQALTDPADTPATADALRDDLVANLIPELRNNFADLTAKVNAIFTLLKNTGLMASV